MPQQGVSSNGGRAQAVFRGMNRDGSKTFEAKLHRVAEIVFKLKFRHPYPR
jgi:hypothetical protein